METITVRVFNKEVPVGTISPEGPAIPGWDGKPVQKYSATPSIGRNAGRTEVFWTRATARFWIEVCGEVALSH